MTGQSNIAVPLTAPLNQIEGPVVLNPETFRVNPVKVAAQRRSNTIIDGLLGGLIGAWTGFRWGEGSPNITATMLTSTALFGGVGMVLAQFGKTREEAYSQILTDAAHSADFTSHVKQEMGRRENSALVNGMLIGSPISIW